MTFSTRPLAVRAPIHGVTPAPQQIQTQQGSFFGRTVSNRFVAASATAAAASFALGYAATHLFPEGAETPTELESTRIFRLDGQTVAQAFALSQSGDETENIFRPALSIVTAGATAIFGFALSLGLSSGRSANTALTLELPKPGNSIVPFDFEKEANRIDKEAELEGRKILASGLSKNIAGLVEVNYLVAGYRKLESDYLEKVYRAGAKVNEDILEKIRIFITSHELEQEDYEEKVQNEPGPAKHTRKQTRTESPYSRNNSPFSPFRVNGRALRKTPARQARRSSVSSH